MSAELCEPLTFRDLQVGQKFICFPEPGDNNGHGGLKGAHFLYEKILHRIPPEKGVAAYHPNCPHGRSKRLLDGVVNDIPLSMLVIIVA